MTCNRQQIVIRNAERILNKNDAVVRYTLPEDECQIFVAQYKLYLLSEAKFIAEIKHEQEALAMAKRMANEEIVSPK